MFSKRSIPLVLGALTATALGTAQVAAQQVPVRELATADAKSPEMFGNIFGVRQLAGGKVLVNDAARRQLVVLDNNFENRTVVVDSVNTGGQSYGPRPSPLIPYLADSSLFVDGTSLSLLVLDPFGKVSHVMSAPKPSDLRFLAGSASGVDAKGNLVYRAAMQITQNRTGPAPTPGTAMPAIQVPDSSPIVRANFDTRMVDTVGRVKIQQGNRAVMSQDANGKMQAKITINPLSTVDEWAVLADGTIAFVRGHDYHVDMLRPDGKLVSSAKLPFDWKRLSDDDKQALIDSARTAMDKAAADAKAAAGTGANAGRAGAEAAMMSGMAAAGMAGGGGGAPQIMIRTEGGGGGGGGGGNAMVMGGGPGGPTGFSMPTMVTEFVPIKEIPDYYPAIRAGATKADLDGNLWILPTTSAQSKAGELIYDVVNNRGELTQRVRLPVNRSIAGFGHNGVIYLMYRDATATGWYLERTKILNYTRATNDQ